LYKLKQTKALLLFAGTNQLGQIGVMAVLHDDVVI